MNNNLQSVQPTVSSNRWLPILQLVFSAFTAVLLLGAAAVITIVNLVEYAINPSTGTDPTQALMIAASLAFAGCVAIPSAWYAWKHLARRMSEPLAPPIRPGINLAFTMLVIVGVAGALWLGNLVSKDSRISWFLLPILNILATGLPALWVIHTGTYRFISGKPARKWGIFASSLILSPIVILVLELFSLVAVGIVGLLWVMLDPTLADQLSSMAFRVQNSGGNPDVLVRILLPFLVKPAVLVFIFVYISVNIPILEEMLKPSVLWLMRGLKITPSQGFAYGILCGVGFGLFENLGNTSGGGETWVLLASARISTLLLHALNTGMVGWALASAWTHKRYLRLGVTLLYAFLMHGLWNGLAVLSFFSSLDSTMNISLPANLTRLGSQAAVGIVALGAFNLVFFLGFSRALRKSLPVESLSTHLDSPGEANPAGQMNLIANPQVLSTREDQSPTNPNQDPNG